MPIEVTCVCGHTQRLSAAFEGMAVICTKCSAKLRAPKLVQEFLDDDAAESLVPTGQAGPPKGTPPPLPRAVLVRAAPLDDAPKASPDHKGTRRKRSLVEDDLEEKATLTASGFVGWLNNFNGFTLAGAILLLLGLIALVQALAFGYNVAVLIAAITMLVAGVGLILKAFINF